jgi:hypothetical protein
MNHLHTNQKVILQDPVCGMDVFSKNNKITAT